MSTRFTRVTVVGDGRQMDISLPADTPIGEQLPTVLRLLSVPNAPVPVRWRLAAPEFGSLDPARSLDEVGVLDGASLYLTEAATAPPPPFVDDVESAVAQEVADRAPSWTGPARRSAVGVLLAILLLAWELSAVTSAPAPLSWLAPLVALVVALGGAALITERGGWFCGITAVPAAAALVLGVVAAAPFAFELPDGSASQLPATGLSALGAASFWNGFPLAVGVAAAATVALLGLVRSAPGGPSAVVSSPFWPQVCCGASDSEFRSSARPVWCWWWLSCWPGSPARPRWAAPGWWTSWCPTSAANRFPGRLWCGLSGVD